MIQTITIDVMNEKAMRLLQDLELLQLIRLRKENSNSSKTNNWAIQYKGTMTKQPLNEIDNQLNDIREGWE